MVLVSSTVSAANNCQILRVTPVNFGVYNPNNFNNVGVGFITLNCDPGVDATVELDYSGLNRNYRELHNGNSAPLSYILCVDSACQFVWGDGLSGTHVYTHLFTKNHSTITVPIYGKLLNQDNNKSAGRFHGDIKVNVSY